jgi:hypothetical protein
MRRGLLLVLLALGSIAGFAAGIGSWRYHREFGWGPHWASHEGRMDAVAEACIRAAERVRGPANAGAGTPAPNAPAL